MIARLHYISQATTELTHLEAIQSACDAGCDWIQLRIKDQTEAQIQTIAEAAKLICDQAQAKLIINDRPAIAKAVQADGVHLGLKDMAHTTARTMLGQHFIIGGTANTFEDIKKYAEEGVVDYVGLGPFRFTTTKKKLSPTLGLEGYRRIIAECQANQITLPIIAIGGIQLEDIEAIMATGVHGIAVSTLITQAVDKQATVSLIQDVIKKKR